MHVVFTGGECDASSAFGARRMALALIIIVRSAFVAPFSNTLSPYLSQYNMNVFKNWNIHRTPGSPINIRKHQLSECISSVLKLV